jgi:hypothetical protein
MKKYIEHHFDHPISKVHIYFYYPIKKKIVMDVEFNEKKKIKKNILNILSYTYVKKCFIS